MSGRAAVFFCPYCAEEDLRPVPEPHGAWRCAACLRTFVVKFVGVGGGVPVSASSSTSSPITGEASP